MGMELESDERFWLERELIERQAFLDEDMIPAAYEMVDFLESAVPTMFVKVRGKRFLLKKEELAQYGT